MAGLLYDTVGRTLMYFPYIVNVSRFFSIGGGGSTRSGTGVNGGGVGTSGLTSQQVADIWGKARKWRPRI